MIELETRALDALQAYNALKVERRTVTLDKGISSAAKIARLGEIHRQLVSAEDAAMAAIRSVEQARTTFRRVRGLPVNPSLALLALSGR
ncbi:hypothetical protein [Actinopolymorpha pittospori]